MTPTTPAPMMAETTTIFNAIECILDDESAWISRPSRDVSMRIAFAATAIIMDKFKDDIAAFAAERDKWKERAIAAEAKLAEVRDEALEDAAKIVLKIFERPNDCFALGVMDPGTGVSECALEVKGDDCLCAERFEEAERIAVSIRARKGIAAAITKGAQS